MAGVALGHIHGRFAWQAWHLATSTFVLSRTIFVTHTILSHTILSHTNFVTHHLSHTIFHTPLCLTPSFTSPSFTHHFGTHHLSHTPSFTHIFVTHHLLHTTLAHTIFHTPSQTIFHTPSFTHHIVTNHLSHTIFHTQLCHTPSFATPSFTHTTLSHTIFPTELCHTLSFTHNFHTHTHTIFHTQLCHTRTIFLCHTPSFTYNFVTHNFVLLLDPPPPPLSFLPSPAPLRHYVIMYVLIIGRSCLVGLSGPLILCVAEIVRKTTSKRFTNDVRNDVGTRPYSHSWPTQTPRQEKLDNPMSELLQSMIDQIRPQGKHPAEFPMAPLNPNNHIYIYIYIYPLSRF